MTRRALAAAVLAAAVLTGCRPEGTEAARIGQDTPRTPGPGVLSVCDQFGNRIYTSTGGTPYGIAATDPTCKETSR